MTEEEENAQNFKITKYINEMDAELKDRFKALQAIAFECNDCDEAESKEIKELELQFENRYKEIYAQRDALINEKAEIDTDLVAKFDERAKKMQDEDYQKLEVEPCDVKAIQNCKGVSDFWMRTILNHQIGEMVSEKDRPILGYLQNIELDLHKDDNGFDLIFTFAANNYFNETRIVKSLQMADKGILDSTSSTAITWKDGCNPTIKKQKKKKKGKKVTVETECESFFNIFKTLDQPEPEKDEQPKDKKVGDEDEEDENDFDAVQEKLADDLEFAEMIKEDVIPLALEYYLGVIEVQQEEEGFEDQDDDGSDDDEDGAKKKKKKGGKKGMQPPLGPDGKPQECKQQ